MQAGTPESEPLVSVAVPVYNHARYIEACLESAADSTHRPLEIVVLDDGSTDDSFAVAQRWGERNAHRLSRFEARRQENAGVTRTLNRLAAMCRGEYIVFPASDDMLLPEGITIRVRALQSRPDWIAVFADSHVIDEQGKLLYPSAIRDLFHSNQRALRSDRHRTSELILRWSAPGPVLMVRPRAFEQMGGFNEKTLVEDRDFYLRLLARNALGYVDQPVAAYRVHGGGTVQSNRANRRVQAAVAEAEIATSRLFSGKHRLLLRLIGADSLASLRFKESPWPLRAVYYVHRSVHKIWLRTLARLHDLHVVLAEDLGRD
jgi:glycosyltransferase involved in cell wall biosynthesis